MPQRTSQTPAPGRSAAPVAVVAVDGVVALDLGAPRRSSGRRSTAGPETALPDAGLLGRRPTGADVGGIRRGGRAWPGGHRPPPTRCVVPGSPRTSDARIQGDVDPAVLDALRAAAGRGARIVSICTGAFVLAAAGLLDGRPATTHWAYANRFRRLYPAVRLDPDVLFVDDGNVLTSAGVAAGIDLCLHLVRGDYGAEVANRAARRCVVAAGP